VGTLEWDIRADESWCSDTLAEIFGHEPGTYNPGYEGFLERVHPEDRGRVRGVLDASVAACAPHELEFRIIRPDGEERWVLAKGRIHCDDNGRAERMVGVTLDITEQKRAEAEVGSLMRELEAERAQLRAIMAQMPSGLAVAEAPSGRLLFHNEAAVRLLGHPLLESEDYTGYTRYGALHPDGRPYRPEEYPIARALLTGETVSQEDMIYRRGDGVVTHFSVNAAPVRDASGRMVAIVSTFDDVAQQRRTEEALRRSEERFRSLVTATSSIVWTSDAGGRITGEIPSWQAFTGQTFDEYQGFGWLDAVHPDDRERAAEGRKLTVRAKRLSGPSTAC
jgi:PAS domain S-box-containing protein